MISSLKISEKQNLSPTAEKIRFAPAEEAWKVTFCEQMLRNVIFSIHLIDIRY